MSTELKPPCSNGKFAGAQDRIRLGLEVQKCAMNEGFAHFYSALSWNSPASDECAFIYYKSEFGDPDPYVDCEGPSSDFPVGYIEDVCLPEDVSGMGVELDWMRQFWDVRTDAISGDPSLSAMIDWVEEANTTNGSFNNSNVFDELDEAADNVGGTINQSWDNRKALNDVEQ